VETLVDKRDEGLLPLEALISDIRKWHDLECPPRCAYRADGLDHEHQRHDDGSVAVVAFTEDGWDMLEFQGTLGF
jgi:hypothetical protein